jgi:small GTP-binding protein
MIKKKICMLGAFAVGKTSLVSRYVKSIFSEKYLTTIGVKTDKKVVFVQEQEVNLVLWDLAGEDDFMQVRLAYLRGASGYILVADGTRKRTLDTAIDLHRRVETNIGKMPFLLVVNKADLADEWDIPEDKIESLIERGWVVLKTSAKTGAGVEEAFLALSERMLDAK